MKDRPMNRGTHLHHTGERRAAPGQVLRRTSLGRRVKEKGNPDVTALGKAQWSSTMGSCELFLVGSKFNSS